MFISQPLHLGLSLLLSLGTASAWYKPSVSTTWQVQYEGDYLNENYVAEVYDIDGFNATSDLITDLHSKYHRVICYMDAGSIESYRPDASSFPASVQGKVLDGWAQEKWLDIRQLSILEPLMLARAKLAQSKGCDGIDWDNVDGYTNDSGFNLTYADQLAYNTMLSNITHGLDMAVGLKNDLDQVEDLVSLFDFAVNESCQQYNECDVLLPFLQAGKPVWGINYAGITKTSQCAAPNGMGIMMLLKKQSLDASGYACWQLLATAAPSTTAIQSTASTSSAIVISSTATVARLQAAPIATTSSKAQTFSSSSTTSSTKTSSTPLPKVATSSSSIKTSSTLALKMTTISTSTSSWYNSTTSTSSRSTTKTIATSTITPSAIVSPSSASVRVPLTSTTSKPAGRVPVPPRRPSRSGNQ